MNKTYFAIAIWWAFVVVGLVPFVIVFLFRSPYPSFISLQMTCRILILALLVYLTFSGVLRTREFYADVRTSIWESSPNTLIHVLQSLRPSNGKWKALTSFHPDPDKRRQVVYETHRLFQVDLWIICSLGIAIGIAFPNIEELLNDLFFLLVPLSIDIWHVGISFYGLAALGTALISASLLVGIVGVNIWRATFAALIQNRPQKGVGHISLCLGGGLILGTLLSLSVENVTFSFTFMDTFIHILSWGLWLLISLVFLLRWIAAEAQIWLEVAKRKKSPHLIHRIGLMIAAGILTVWLIPIFLFRTFTLIISINKIDFTHVNIIDWLLLIQIISSSPGSLLAFISLWAFPLSAWFWRKKKPLQGNRVGPS